jgi:hypothetical protein
MRQSHEVQLFQKVNATNLHCRIFDELDYVYNMITEDVRRLNELGKHHTLVEFHGTGGTSGYFISVWQMVDNKLFDYGLYFEELEISALKSV